MNPSQANTPRDLAKWTAKVAMILGVGQAQTTNVRSSAKMHLMRLGLDQCCRTTKMDDVIRLINTVLNITR